MCKLLEVYIASSIFFTCEDVIVQTKLEAQMFGPSSLVDVLAPSLYVHYGQSEGFSWASV